MRLEGWNSIPAGYGARFSMSEAPRWLRIWFRTPLLDRFAYPIAVRRGFGYLTPSPSGSAHHEPGPGWRIAEDYGTQIDYRPPQG